MRLNDNKIARNRALMRSRKIKIYFNSNAYLINSFQKKLEERKHSFSRKNAFCQLRPKAMLGYSYFFPKLISYFSIHDVDFHCFIGLTEFEYSLIKIRLPFFVVFFHLKRAPPPRSKKFHFLTLCTHTVLLTCVFSL